MLHLDIKSLNFLLTDDLTVKIADLELSREIVIQQPVSIFIFSLTNFIY